MKMAADMTTLISWSSSSGAEGRCDAKCYNAASPDCDCICGGCNHGKGLSKALENTRQLAEQMIAHYRQTHDMPSFQADVNQNVFQLPLF